MRPRAYAPGQGHRFLPGSTVCVHCGRSSTSSLIRRMCPVGVLYEFRVAQGEIVFDRIEMLVSIGALEES